MPPSATSRYCCSCIEIWRGPISEYQEWLLQASQAFAASKEACLRADMDSVSADASQSYWARSSAADSAFAQAEFRAS